MRGYSSKKINLGFSESRPHPRKETSNYKSTTKMGMLRSSIADPPPPDPFAMPLSKYRETRLKSTKDLVYIHKNSQGRVP